MLNMVEYWVLALMYFKWEHYWIIFYQILNIIRKESCIMCNLNLGMFDTLSWFSTKLLLWMTLVIKLNPS